MTIAAGRPADVLLDHPPKLLDRMLAAFCLRACESGRIRIRSEMMTGRQRTDQVFPIDIREREDARCFPMKTAGEADDVGSFRVRSEPVEWRLRLLPRRR